jgi:hypothetical protein
MAATVVVSPRLADAVLSCWAVLDTDAEHEPDVRRLDDEPVERKLEVLREYRTQFPAFSGGPLRIAEHPAVRGWEVPWWLRG